MLYGAASKSTITLTISYVSLCQERMGGPTLYYNLHHNRIFYCLPFFVQLYRSIADYVYDLKIWTNKRHLGSLLRLAESRSFRDSKAIEKISRI